MVFYVINEAIFSLWFRLPHTNFQIIMLSITLVFKFSLSLPSCPVLPPVPLSPILPLLPSLTPLSSTSLPPFFCVCVRVHAYMQLYVSVTKVKESNGQ